MPFTKAEDPSMEVFPVVNNFDGKSWYADISTFLNDPQARSVFRAQAIQFLASGRYRGLMVDFETFPPSGQSGYLAFINEVAGATRQSGVKRWSGVSPPNTANQHLGVPRWR